jgi:DNA polymerase I-like protein with 3'-5' exonuclease and polymerase domains
MTKLCFLAHVIDPFGIEDPALVIATADGMSRTVTLHELEMIEDLIVSYEVSVLIGALKAESFGLPRQIIDIKDGLKLASGISKDQGGERQWSTFRQLAIAEPGSYAKELAEMARGQRLQPGRSELFELLTRASVALVGLWNDLQLALGMTGEWERFIQIEVPVQQIFWYRQYHGISLDQAAWQNVLQRTQKEKYDAFREVARMIGVSPSTIKFQNIGKHLKGTDAAFLSEFAESSSIESCFEAASEHSEFARAFVAFSQARKDESTLLRINPEQERMFPVFECFGTVTGRIIVLNPALQSLKRRHRQIVAADAGKKLLYLDYVQFEPGILAQLSNDASFVEAYNRSDLYAELSKVLFGTPSRRSEAKGMFLSYSYGMSPDSIATLMCGNNATAEEIIDRKNTISCFFADFPGLERLRANLLDELQEKGAIASLMGNHRRRIHTGRLSGKEQNWALSQRIQGTASLIFKEALIHIAEACGPEAILLPMHDAVLIQVPEDDEAVRKVELTEIMVACFKKWCPDIRVRVSSEDFASTVSA